MVLRLKPIGKLITVTTIWVLDRTKVLHGPRTQTYGKLITYDKYLSVRQNEGLAWSSDSNLWEN